MSSFCLDSHSSGWKNIWVTFIVTFRLIQLWASPPVPNPRLHGVSFHLDILFDLPWEILWAKGLVCLNSVLSLSFFSFFFFLRKISPELTSAANPSLFHEEDWPWANIRAHLPLLYTWDTFLSMVCQAVPCPHPGSQVAKPGQPRSGTCELNRCATGPAPRINFF